MSTANKGWIDVGAIAALEAGGRLETEVDDLPVTVVRVGGQLYAFEDRCTHDDAPLTGGELEANPGDCEAAVVCPHHGARFCLRTGAALTPPAYEPIRVFAVRNREGRLEIRAP